MLSYGTSAMDAGVRDAIRFLLDRVPEACPLADGGGVLEHGPTGVEPPRTFGARVLEGTTLRPHRIPGEPASTFAAFLDGIQRSRVVMYLPGGIPVVEGTIAAVIRERRNRRMVTWEQRRQRRLCLPLDLVPDAGRLQAELGHAILDTSKPVGGDEAHSRHPLALLDRAMQVVQHARETLEQRLAERWCGTQHAPLYIDGGIAGSSRTATASCTVGVVKSHRRLYAEGDALAVVFGLHRGERTSVFRVESSNRPAVASWYLRLRDAQGRDPMWGLVRVEIADGADAVRRADDVSRWILAEAAPLSLPDARWDKMVYGIRDCEEFLRAVSS